MPWDINRTFWTSIRTSKREREETRRKGGWEAIRFFSACRKYRTVSHPGRQNHIRKRGTKSRSLAGKYPCQPAKPSKKRYPQKPWKREILPLTRSLLLDVPGIFWKIPEGIVCDGPLPVCGLQAQKETSALLSLRQLRGRAECMDLLDVSHQTGMRMHLQAVISGICG